MLTTRVYIWSSALLALTSVLDAREMSEIAKDAIKNTLCVVIVLGLVWPQRLLFVGLRRAIVELWSQRTISETGSATGSDKTFVRGDSRSTNSLPAVPTPGDDETTLIEKMIKSKDTRELFALQREMLLRDDLPAIERARWTSKAASPPIASKSNLRVIRRLSVCLEKLRRYRACRIVLRFGRLLMFGCTFILMIVGAFMSSLAFLGQNNSSSWKYYLAFPAMYLLTLCMYFQRPSRLGAFKRSRRFMRGIMQLCLGGFTFFLAGTTAIVLVNAVVLSPGTDSEYVWVSTSVLSAVLSEVLRVRWTNAYDKATTERHSSDLNYHIARTKDDEGTSNSVKSEQGKVEVRAGSLVSVFAKKTSVAVQPVTS